MTAALVALAAPFVALALLGVVPPLRRSGRPAAFLSIAAMGTSFVASLVVLASRAGAAEPAVAEILWAPMREYAPIRFGILVDGLSAAMLCVVALVALLVQIYSLGYMSDETPAGLGRYYAYHSLFAFAMMGLVLAHNTLQTYVFWELVGLGSYLLIGFWFHKPEASRAAVKAFWTTRLADVGFAIGVVLLWWAGGSFVFTELFDHAASGVLSGGLLAIGVAGLYVGAMGKSAQFPFHIWLPDAMEGPTPVSALIHAATMVAAGVYLMIRIAPLLAHTPEVAAWVLGIGALTAFVAAAMALVERDIKRILAFSTVSQLGYMMAAVGAGAAASAFFHLFTHAFFKALLFLGAGAVIHALHTNDIFAMGRLFGPMRRTGLVFLAGTLALCGIPPFAGFFSKDEILVAAWAGGHPLAFAVLLLTAGMTAFYMFRLVFTVFFGAKAAPGHPHEAPASMLGPMAVLAFLSLTAGFAGSRLAHLVSRSISLEGAEAHGHGGLLVPALGLAAAVAGIAIAWAGYQRGAFDPAQVRARFALAGRILERRFYVDDAFEAGYRVLYLALTRLVGWIDRFIVDGVVNLATQGVGELGSRLRGVQNGRVQDALYAVVLGFLLLVLLAAGGR